MSEDITKRLQDLADERRADRDGTIPGTKASDYPDFPTPDKNSRPQDMKITSDSQVRRSDIRSVDDSGQVPLEHLPPQLPTPEEIEIGKAALKNLRDNR